MKLSCCCSLKFSILWQLILLIPQILTERLDNKIFSTLTLSDESEFVLEYDYHWETFPADIRKSFTLSLEDSFYGKQIQFIHERNVGLNLSFMLRYI